MFLPFADVTYAQFTVTVTAQNNPAKEGTEQQLTCVYGGLNGSPPDIVNWSKGPMFSGASLIAAYRLRYDEVTYGSYGNPGEYYLFELICHG